VTPDENVNMTKNETPGEEETKGEPDEKMASTASNDVLTTAASPKSSSKGEEE